MSTREIPSATYYSLERIILHGNTLSRFIKKVFPWIERVYRFSLVVLISSLEEFLLPAHPGEKISPVETVYVGSGRIRGIHLRRTDRVTFDNPTATQG